MVAAALATCLLVLGGLIVDRYVGTVGGLSVVTPAGSGAFSRPDPAATPPVGVAPAPGTVYAPVTPPPVTPPTATATPDPATAGAIRAAFEGAFDGDADPDDGLTHVQDGARYRAITQRFLARYPGTVGTLTVRVTSIAMLNAYSARVDLVFTHRDPALGGRWGYTINEPGHAVREDGRWLVSAQTYSFLVGTA